MALLASRYTPLLSFAPACAFRKLTGFPCPTCGGTRSLVCLAHGDIAAAVVYNPLITVCVIAAVILLLYKMIALAFQLPRIVLVLNEREKDAARVGIFVLVLLQWLYGIIIL